MAIPFRLVLIKTFNFTKLQFSQLTNTATTHPNSLFQFFATS
jgi:hypothetical protein